MKKGHTQHKQQSISIIGARHFPSEFTGTSGVEVYVENILKELIKPDKKYFFRIYVKANYSSLVKRHFPQIQLIRIPTLHLKVLESVIYSFVATCMSALDTSSIIWYQGIGPAIFAWIPRILNKQTVITIHSTDWQRDKWTNTEKFIFRLLSKIVFTQTHQFTAVSMQLIKQLSPITVSPFLFTPPGLSVFPQKTSLREIHRLNLKPKKYLLYLGRFVPEKRPEWLLETFMQLRVWYPQLKLVMAGGHGNMTSYEKKLKQKFNHHTIKWPGYVFGLEKWSLISYSLAMVLPSRLEGTPLCVMEALSQNIPCVVADGILDARITKKPLIYEFKKNNYADFQKVLEKIVNSQHSISKITSTSGKVSNEYSWNKTSHHFRNLFDSLGK